MSRFGAVGPNLYLSDDGGAYPALGTVQAQFSDSMEEAGVVARCVTIDPSGLPHLETGACS